MKMCPRPEMFSQIFDLNSLSSIDHQITNQNRKCKCNLTAWKILLRSLLNSSLQKTQLPIVEVDVSVDVDIQLVMVDAELKGARILCSR